MKDSEGALFLVLDGNITPKLSEIHIFFLFFNKLI